MIVRSVTCREIDVEKRVTRCKSSKIQNDKYAVNARMLTNANNYISSTSLPDDISPYKKLNEALC